MSAGEPRDPAGGLPLGAPPAGEAEASPDLRGHYVVFGCGRVGRQVVTELRRLAASVVVVDRSAEGFRLLGPEPAEGCMRIVGDAFDPDVLARTQLDRAVGVASTLHLDQDNLFLCLRARRLNRTARIVTRVGDMALAQRFRMAGVDTVASPARMGGVRLARELLVPGLATFADALLASGDRMVLLLAIPIAADGAVAGRTLAEADLTERTGCVVMGVRTRPRGTYVYHPPPSMRLKVGGTLVALGEARELLALQALVAGSAAGPDEA